MRKARHGRYSVLALRRVDGRGRPDDGRLRRQGPASKLERIYRGQRKVAIETMSKVDVVVAVSSHDPIGRLDEPDEMTRTYQRQARAPFNLTGHPALSVPDL